MIRSSPAISIFENGIVQRPRESRRRTITAQLLAQFLGQYSGHLFCVIAADQFVRVLVAIVVLNRITPTVGQYDHAVFDNEAALNDLAWARRAVAYLVCSRSRAAPPNYIYIRH